MATIRDAVNSILGPGGAVVRSREDECKRLFTNKAVELGNQIASDNEVKFNSEAFDALDRTTLLSSEAEALLAELRAIKERALRPA